MLLFPNLQENGNEPQYLQLYKHIKEEILSSKLAADTHLPSVRKLAEFLMVSTTVVETAYSQLVSEGLIESKPRKGFFVQNALEQPPIESIQEKNNSRNSSINKERFSYDFHMSQNDFSQFPYSLWGKLYQEALNYESENNLFFGNPQGELGLRTALAAYLKQIRGVECSPEQIVIGADQFWLMSILSLILKPQHQHLAAENASYVLIPSTFKQNGYIVTKIPMTDEGIDVPLLYNTKATIVAVSPSHSFPIGVFMSMDKRYELLRWAEKVNGLIIEDDYDGEFYYGKPFPAIQGMHPNSPVIYLGGFSQAVAPALCVSYMVLPKILLPRYYEVQNEILIEQPSSKLHQRALQLLIERGHLERHLRKMRTLYRRKHDLIVKSVEKYFNEYGTVSGTNGGFHIILEITSSTTEKDLLLKAGNKGIRVASAAYSREEKTNKRKKFILGFAGIQEDLIEEGIERLFLAWNKDLLLD
ncbi:MocR-like pyridoxine biosynthesis transcription factor PdxR [Neobacillus dielmonensis]|uniref:MocR-like pyridoxine biosynthesis transcription factor PdxR n=1 Tax=Neobacillus dielmonensis TaxID=1347369 RepID=UPI0005A7AC21|nr:PLP-dependent aminotransferase family protein [Neobacillus dielmonensis]